MGGYVAHMVREDMQTEF